jgi:hypothetical protein
MPVDELPWTFESIEDKIKGYDGEGFREYLLKGVNNVLMGFGYNPEWYYHPVEHHRHYDKERNRIDSINKTIDDILKMSEIIFQPENVKIVEALYYVNYSDDEEIDNDAYMAFCNNLYELMSGMWFYGDKDKGTYTDLRLRFHRFKWLLEKGEPFVDPLQKS